MPQYRVKDKNGEEYTVEADYIEVNQAHAVSFFKEVTEGIGEITAFFSQPVSVRLSEENTPEKTE